MLMHSIKQVPIAWAIAVSLRAVSALGAYLIALSNLLVEYEGTGGLVFMADLNTSMSASLAAFAWAFIHHVGPYAGISKKMYPERQRATLHMCPAGMSQMCHTISWDFIFATY